MKRGEKVECRRERMERKKIWYWASKSSSKTQYDTRRVTTQCSLAIFFKLMIATR